MPRWNSRTTEDRFWSKVEKTSGGCWIWTAYKNANGYGKFVIFSGGAYRSKLAHRVSYEMSIGNIADGSHIDHTCHNPACVNPSHLRPVSVKQNLENRKSANSNTKSGIRGVSWFSRDSTWRATVMHNGKQHSAGYHKDLAAAEAAVIALRNELFTHNDLDRKRGASS